VASYRYVVCDVFTETPLAGNQLAVFTDARGLTPGQSRAAQITPVPCRRSARTETRP